MAGAGRMLTSHTSTLRNSAGATTQLSPHWRNILNVFDQLLATLKQNNVPPFLVSCLLACQQHWPGCLWASCLCLTCVKSLMLASMLMPSHVAVLRSLLSEKQKPC